MEKYFYKQSREEGLEKRPSKQLRKARGKAPEPETLF